MLRPLQRRPGEHAAPARASTRARPHCVDDRPLRRDVRRMPDRQPTARPPRPPPAPTRPSRAPPATATRGRPRPRPCPASAAPYCEASGTCGVCTGDADCARQPRRAALRHDDRGVRVHVRQDSDCPPSVARAGRRATVVRRPRRRPSVCQAKAANGEAVPGGRARRASRRARASRACATRRTTSAGSGTGAACSSAAECQCRRVPDDRAQRGQVRGLRDRRRLQDGGRPRLLADDERVRRLHATNPRRAPVTPRSATRDGNACSACGGDVGSERQARLPDVVGALLLRQRERAGSARATPTAAARHTPGRSATSSTGACTSACSGRGSAARASGAQGRRPSRGPARRCSTTARRSRRAGEPVEVHGRCGHGGLRYGGMQPCHVIERNDITYC